MKLPKQVDAFIKAIQKDLPVQHYQAKITKRLTGKELIKEGVEKVEEKDVDPDGSYIRTGGRNHEINHVRRLRKAYARNKAQGLIDYVIPFCKPESKQKLIDNINSICTA